MAERTRSELDTQVADFRTGDPRNITAFKLRNFLTDLLDSCCPDASVMPLTPATAQVGVAWSTDDTIDAAEIAALVTSTSRVVEIPALPAGETSARLILWTADASGDIMGVAVTMQFSDQLNIFDNANVEAQAADEQAGMARISVNPLGAAYANQMLTVTF